MIQYDDLLALSPVDSIPWDAPGMRDLYRFRFDVWKKIRESSLVETSWSKSVFDGLFGSHPYSWRVVGMTRDAMARLAGSDGTFSSPREPGVYIRSHLYPRRQTTLDLRALPGTTTFEEFVAFTWPRDITVIGLKSQDRLLESPDYFKEHATTWRNDDGSLFTEAGKGWKYGTKERVFLRGRTT